MNEVFFTIVQFGGYNYWCPKQIGAGLRAEFHKLLMQAIEKLDNIDLIAPMMNALEAGNDFVFEQEYRKLMSVNPESFSKLVDFARVQNAAILEALLVPCEGSPSVRDTYNFAATEEEVEKLVNFFKRNAAPKTNAARGKTGTGKGSARKRASR